MAKPVFDDEKITVTRLCSGTEYFIISVHVIVLFSFNEYFFLFAVWQKLVKAEALNVAFKVQWEKSLTSFVEIFQFVHHDVLILMPEVINDCRWSTVNLDALELLVSLLLRHRQRTTDLIYVPW